MSEIRISYDPEAIKQVTGLNGLKGKNLVANEVYAHEDWLDDAQCGANSTDHEISGTEFLNFAKHIDTDGDNKITDTEIEQWRASNKSVGNTAHKGFSDEEVMELFDLVITQANEKTGKSSGKIYTGSTESAGNSVFDFNSSGGVGNRRTLPAKNYDAWADSIDTSRIVYDDATSSSVKNSYTVARAIDTEEAKSKNVEYDSAALSSASDDVVDSTLKQLRGTNFVVQNIYAHEEWLDGNKYDGKATNKNVDLKISGEELASFASHIDQNNDGRITYDEFKQWREDNISAGNTAHANFTYEQVQEIFNSVNKRIK